MKAAIEERFWSKVEKTESCWFWKGKLNHGYGSLWWKGIQGAHRISYILHVGVIPKGYCVLHHCDNTSCVNPEHLFLGNRTDNASDRHRKSRDRSGHLFGESHGRALLTYDQVKEIKKRSKNGVTKARLAKDFQVSESCIYHIVNNRSWNFGKGGKYVK